MPQRNVATNFTFEQQRQEINLLAADFWSQKGTVDTAAPTYLKHDGSNNFTGQTLNVPNAFTISANSGSGTLTISGNLDVTGTTTTVSTANLEVTDKNILIAKGSTSDAQADGAGITIDSATDITFNFVDANDALVSSIGLEGTTFVKAPYGQFTGSGTSSTGQGVEINAPDANTGQIISYDRANTAYKELRIKGSSVGIYGGTSNALVGTFNSTGLDIVGNIDSNVTGGDNSLKIETTTSGDPQLNLNAAGSGGHVIEYIRSTNTLNFKQGGGSVRMSIAAGGDVSIANNLDVTGNVVVGNNDTVLAENTVGFKSSGKAYIDHHTTGQDIDFRLSSSSALDTTPLVVKSSGIDVTGDLSVSGNTTLGNSNTADTLTIKGSMVQLNDSSETDYAAKSLPSGDSGFYIRNANGGVGTYASLGIIASNGSSDQSFSIITKCTNSGLSPEVFFTQRNGNNSQRDVLKIDTNGEAVFEGNLVVGGNHPWAVTSATGYNNLSVSGDSASSSGFLNLGNGAATTNGGFDLARIKIHNGATEVVQIAGTTATSANDDGVLRFLTKSTTPGTLVERLQISGSNTHGQFILKRSESTNQNVVFYYDANYLDIETREATGIRLKTNQADRFVISKEGTCTFGPGLLEESFINDTGGGIQSNYIHHIMTYGEVFYGVTNAVANFTFDVVGNGSTDYNDITTVNKVSTVTIYVTANGKYMTEFRIDGTAQTVKWAGGSAPAAGSASGVDVYSMTIMKTAASTYHVFGNVTNFA